MQPNPRFTNRLAGETSPYLLQHAHNPVDWYPWGDEAFERARAEDKPVIVSIGYSACHWCHVMEHESFEDEKTAAVMNEHFINIKVDMEERPDVDQIYMNFVQLTTGRGGWPMNVFVTPDKRPFFGGTYFPPSPRYGMPSWTQILMSIAEAYKERRDELEASANEILKELRRMSEVTATGPGISRAIPDLAVASFRRSFDAVNGGFGGAPKFPQAMSLEFLLRVHHRSGDADVLKMVTHTLDKMAAGGIYDHLGGGFHRYAVDAIWLVPHFEKMLYDNAQLARVYLHAFQVTGEERYRRVAVETLDYVRREMLDSSGGFYSTQDADSEGEEGKFFVWDPEEIRLLVGDEAADELISFYGVTADGNFEGKNILNLRDAMPPAELPPGIAKSRAILFGAREQRVKPGRDEKVLAAWNGLMLGTFADAAGVLGSAEYRETAQRCARFLAEQMTNGGMLRRTWKNGAAKLNGYIEDYANYADGLIELFRVTGDTDHLDEARRVAEVMIAEFWDEENGGFFFTSNEHEELVVRNKDFYDNATPSGNSVAADALLRLHRITGDDRYERYAVTTMRLAAAQVQRYPQGFGRMLSALELFLSPAREIAVAGPAGNALEMEVLATYLPTTVVAVRAEEVREADLKLTAGRKLVDGQPAAYICENFVCKRPVITAAELHDSIRSAS
jgi:uncharacterized protein YyaL (SSP411 family)